MLVTDTERLYQVLAGVLKCYATSKGCLGIPTARGQVGLPKMVLKQLCRENKLGIDKALFF